MKHVISSLKSFFSALMHSFAKTMFQYFSLLLRCLDLCSVHHLALDLHIVLQWMFGFITNVSIPLESQNSFITCSNSVLQSGKFTGM